MKLKITTLIIIEGNQVEDIYHSLEDNQDKAYQDLINQVNATYGDGGVLQFKNIKGIKELLRLRNHRNPKSLYQLDSKIPY